jgi:hypothetical protein
MDKIVTLVLRFSEWILGKYLKSIPDNDLYAIVYCIVFDVAQSIRIAADELSLEVKEAKSSLKEFPDQPGNGRARDYSHMIGPQYQTAESEQDILI